MLCKSCQEASEIVDPGMSSLYNPAVSRSQKLFSFLKLLSSLSILCNKWGNARLRKLFFKVFGIVSRICGQNAYFAFRIKFFNSIYFLCELVVFIEFSDSPLVEKGVFCRHRKKGLLTLLESWIDFPTLFCAEVVKLVDTLDSGSSPFSGIGVRVPSSAPLAFAHAACA